MGAEIEALRSNQLKKDNEVYILKRLRKCVKDLFLNIKQQIFKYLVKKIQFKNMNKKPLIKKIHIKNTSLIKHNHKNIAIIINIELYYLFIKIFKIFNKFKF